jgi:hypothetical protein
MPIDAAAIALAIERVEQDVVGGFDDILTPDGAGAFAIDLDESGLTPTEVVATSEVVVVVPWVFRCVHTGTFIGVQATFVHFDLRGTTVVHVGSAETDPDEWTYHRYIDFLCALHHMGISTGVRPALTPDEFLEWKAETGSH